MLLNKSGLLKTEEEEEPEDEEPTIIHKDPFNLSNDECYNPKLTTESRPGLSGMLLQVFNFVTLLSSKITNLLAALNSCGGVTCAIFPDTHGSVKAAIVPSTALEEILPWRYGWYWSSPHFAIAEAYQEKS